MVQWYYFALGQTDWYIVDSAGSVLYLVGSDAQGGLIWKPINNFQAWTGNPAAGQNFASVNISADGRTVSFGSAAGAMSNDPKVAALANTTQTVQWYYFAVGQTDWYIVNSAGSVLYLVGGDAQGGLIWKPINNFQAWTGNPAAGQNFASVNISPDGRTVSFGSLCGC
jgi:hypothetical protein